MLNLNIEEKVAAVVERLRTLKTVDKKSIATEISDKVDEKGVFYGSDEDFKPFESPYILFEQDKYFCFRGSFEIEEIRDDEKAYLSIETFIGGVAPTMRPQGLLKLNGEIIQGIDINHTDVLLDSGKYDMELIFYTHIFGLSLPVYFSVKRENTLINDLYNDLSIALAGMKLLLKNTDDYVFAKYHLERAINLIDFREEYGAEFFNSLKRARDYLYKNYFGKGEGIRPVVNCVGHTHIDVAWLWDEEQTRQKTERSFATVLKLMEEYPEYKFMMSQPQLFAFLKERNPEIFARIKEKVKEGRWELDGSMWLEADCNLTSGESLVRQIYYGKKFFKDEFGVDCSCIFEPDVFGYSAALPQIMLKSGIKRFVTAKIGWNDTDRMPYDAFVWQGIDGSKVFAYFISTCDCDPRNGVYDRTYTTYTGPISPQAVLGTWHRFQPKEFSAVTLLTYGYGDGGGGPTREMLETEKRLRKGIPGIPRTKLATLKETLDEIEDNFKANAKELKRYPKWNGELYFEYHRGTLTSVPRIKKHNRDGEFALMNAELVQTLASTLFGADYECETIERNWKILLLNQFHDILPGSAIKKVYEDSDEQFEKMFADLGGLIGKSLDVIAKNISTDGGLLVFNPNGFAATSTVVSDGKTVVVEDVPSLGYKVCKPRVKNNSVKVGKLKIESGDYVVRFDKSGAISSLFDKNNGKQIVKQGEKINAFAAYEDMPYEYDNWEITPYHKQKRYALDGEAFFEKIEDGDRAGFKITKKYGKSVIVQNVYLYNGLRRIDFETDVIWNEKKQLLKVEFPFGLLVDKAVYDIQFGNEERSTSTNTSWDSARFESAGQKWVDMSENNYGVALLNDGKYGFGTEDSLLTMTVCKCGGFPYYEAGEKIPRFTYSLLPHDGDFRGGGVINEAYLLNRGFITKKLGMQKGSLGEEYSFAKCLTDGVFMETVKQAEDGEGIMLRMYEGFRESKRVNVVFDKEIYSAYICDLSENELIAADIAGNKVAFDIKPYEIITLKIK